ncbi:MAG: hypothetical protein A2Y33_06400 [Spirochaetes bacterium GWF1_51_8]|nr:MAG: hypothetical protein A2Y33_06400 [Spirochaetes bacterium GWF1_51_8]
MKSKIKRFFGIYLFLLIAGGLFIVEACSLNPFYGVGANAQETNALPDLSAPVISIISPVSNQEISGVINLVGTAADVSEIEYVKVSITGTNSADYTNAVVNKGVFSYSWDVAGYAEGNYTIYVYAADVAGNIAAVSQVDIIIDREVPTVSITSPTNGNHYKANFNIAGSAHDSNTINLVQYSLDNQNWTSFSIVSGSSVNFTTLLNTASLTNGQYSIKVRAFDKTGKYGTAATILTIDKELPVTTVLSPTNETTLGVSFNINATASDNQGINYMLIRMQGVLIASNSGGVISKSFVTNSTFEGSHTITIEAYDFAGNKDEENIFCVINENPARISGITLSSSGSGNYLTGVAAISGTGFDSGTGEISNIFYKVGAASAWIQFATNCGVLTTNWTFNLNTALYPGGTNTLFFKPVDNLGGFVIASTNIYIDNTAPIAVFVNPTANFEAKGGYLTISVNISDNVSLKQFTLYTNGNVCTNIASILPLNTKSKLISALWDLVNYNDGTTNTIIAVVKDTVNKTYTLTNKFIVQNNTPSIIVQNPAIGSYVPVKINIKGIAVRSDGIKPSWIKIDNGAWRTVLQTNTIVGGGITNIFNHTTNAASMAEGDHTITIRAFASNGSYIDEFIPVILDKTFPVASITSPTNGVKYYGTLLLAGTASDNKGISYTKLKVTTNGVTVFGPTNLTLSAGKWSLNWNTVTLPVGNIKVILEVSDLAGNIVYKTNSATIAPYITYVSDSSAWIGKSITNKGSNFGNGTVTINFKGGATTNATATMTNLIYTVPSGAKSGYVSFTVKGINSINSNWMDFWSFAQVYANASGQQNSRFCVGDDDQIYFVQSAKSGSVWASNIMISSYPSAYTVKNFFKSHTPNGEVVGQGNAIDVQNNVMAIAFSPSKTNGVFVSVFTNSGSSWVFVTTKRVLVNSLQGTPLMGIKVDSNKKIHLAYSWTIAGAIGYGVSSDLGTTWATNHAVTGVTFDPVILDAMPSIDVDSGGNPHIVYFNYATQKLKHTWKSAGVWYNETVDPLQYNGAYASIKIDAANGMHVSYYNGDQGDLMYCYKPSSGFWTAGQLVDYSAITGQYTSIDVMGTQKIISYFSAAYNNAWLAYYNGTSWHNALIPRYTPGTMGLPYGKFSGTGFTSDGRIYVGFVDLGNKLWLAEYLK